MKKVFTIFALTVLIICSAFSFDFGGGAGAGLKIGNPNGWSGGFYEAWGFTKNSSKENTGTVTVQLFVGYKNFIFGLGPTEFLNRDSSNPDTPAPDMKISFGYNFDLHTLVTPSVFVEYTTNNTLSVSVVAMFNWYPHKHNYKTIDYKEATCIEDGYRTYECSSCGKVYTTVYPFTSNHNYVEVEHVDPTCTEKGKRVFECSVCNKKYIEEIRATGNHNYVEVEHVDPTCTEKGYDKFKCVVCENVSTKNLSPTGHTFILTEEVVEKGNGYRVYTCFNCGYEEQRKISNTFEIKNFVDDFGDATNKKYITQKKTSVGTFNNSATTNSSIDWYFIISETEISFVIYEYGWSKVTGSVGYPDKYTISIKKENGKVETFIGENYSDRITIISKDLYSFRNLLLQEGTIKIAIKENTSYSASSYNLGSINLDGIGEMYRSL